MKAQFLKSIACLTLGTGLAWAEAPAPLVSLGRPVVHSAEDVPVAPPALGRPPIVRAATLDPLLGPNNPPPPP